MANDAAELFNKINIRFDDIEKLLQLLLVNNLIEDSNQIVRILDGDIDTELQNLIDKYGVKFGGFRTISDIEVLVVEVPEGIKLKAKELSNICFEIRHHYLDKEPLLMFRTINGMQRKRILQEGLSFGVYGKELHIASGGIRRWI